MSLTEKHRPKSFDDPNLIKTKPIQILEARVDVDRPMPHLLFAGDAGIGKTTIAQILIRKMCNLNPDESISDYCMVLNASDERGITVVRGKIKEYASTRAIHTDKRYIFLDEMDALTPDAQNALRRTMEEYWDTCMFILSCNYPHKVIAPLVSRCAVFKFPRPSEGELFKLVKHIITEENINITDDAIDEIIRQTDCDIRGTINYIDGHSANLLIEKSDIQIVDSADELVELIINCKSVEEIKDFFKDKKIDYKYTASCMIDAINKRLIASTRYSEIIENLTETVYRCNALSKTDGKLQLYGFCVWLFNLLGSINDIDTGTSDNTERKTLGQCEDDDKAFGTALESGKKGEPISVLIGTEHTDEEIKEAKDFVDDMKNKRDGTWERLLK